MNIKIFSKACFAMGLLLYSSCGDFLEDYSQDTAYVRGYSDLDELLLGSAYMPTGTPQSIGQDDEYIEKPYFYPYIHLMGDEVEQNTVDATGSSALWPVAEKYFGWYTFQQQVGIDATGTELRKEDTDWKHIYECLSVANMVIASIDAQNSRNEKDELEKQRIKGEAYFIRGAYYFILANLYGKAYTPATAQTDLAVPIKLTEYIEDKIFNRKSVAEVYGQAEQDLLEAERLLTGTTRKSYYHANKTAAELLLSRLYLYKQDWTKAETYGEKVINAGDNHLKDLNGFSEKFFLNPSNSEIIFTMGNGGLRYTITGNIGDFGVSDNLWNKYDDKDLRKTYYVRVNPDKGFHEYIKGGEVDDLTNSSLSTVFLLRTSEAYLNVAEAAACAGDNATAQQMINALRRTRFAASDYQDVNLTGNELIDFIREERARELCLEGHRWFDLRRYAVSTVRPYTKVIRHGFTTFTSGYVYNPATYSYTFGTFPKQTRYYELEPNDPALTLTIPREVINFNIGMPNNSRPVRNVVETINY